MRARQNVVFAVIFFVTSSLLLTACGGGSVSPSEMVRKLEEAIYARAKGDRGPKLAIVENEVIYKKLFDLQLDFVLKLQKKMSAADQLKIRKDADTLKRMLRSMTFRKLILHEIESDPEFKNDPEFLLFIYLKLAEGIQEYYLAKKLGDRVNAEVSDKDIEELYNKYNQDPRYRERFARMDMKTIRRLLRSQILQQRQAQLLQEQLLKLQGKYKVDMKEEKLLQESGKKDSKPQEKKSDAGK